MGTNFYARKLVKGNGVCPKCGGNDVYLTEDRIKCIECNYGGPNEETFNKIEEIHIGKRSAGWQFLLNPTFKTGEEWKKFISGNEGKIFDEYERSVSAKEMLDIIETKGTTGKTATKEQYGLSNWEDNEFFDEDGYRISKYKDFS